MKNFVPSVSILSRATVRVQGKMISLENRATCAKILFCNIAIFPIYFSRGIALCPLVSL